MPIESESGNAAISQTDVIEFLADADNYPGVDIVQRIDTHAAVVFLAGSRAYKIKRQVVYPFLDFSTLEKRRLVCENEIKVNQDNAPQIYNKVIPITVETDGSLKIDGTGKVVEWAVRMVRFDENLTLDRVIENGPFPDELIDALALEMVGAHGRAPLREAGSWIADLRRYLDQNGEAFARHVDLFSIDQAEWLNKASIDAYDNIKPLLEARGCAGLVCLCHGDAHLGNIVLIDGKPVLFDALEFDDVIATADVLYDLSFLLMDLWEHGHIYEANRIFNRYLVEARNPDHYQGLATLPFFLMLRAAIRAKVSASRLEFCASEERSAITADAKAYFIAAGKFMNETRPRLFVLGGLSGSGKTTVAARIAAKIGRAPGAVILRSDVMRKELFGVDEKQRLPSKAYSASAHEMVYDHLYKVAGQILKAGQSVIVDAVFALEYERIAIEKTGRILGIEFTGLWLDAPIEILIDRVEKRLNDASDANREVVKKQQKLDIGDMSWHQIDASGRLRQSLDQVLNFVE
ncbi:MAG: AAA family ATPase [Hyphomicrobiales bacterium]|nr:AAA family ATPase [Hyphomicrobiales bacterium]